MKLIIDIDNNLYTRLFDNGVDNYDDAVDMAKAIRKGTLIPDNATNRHSHNRRENGSLYCFIERSESE